MLKLLFLLQITLFAIQSSLAELVSFKDSNIHFIQLTNYGEYTRECWVPPISDYGDGYYEVLEEGTLSYQLNIIKNDQGEIILELYEFNLFHATNECRGYTFINGEKSYFIYKVERDLKKSFHRLTPGDTVDGREIFRVSNLENGYLHLNNQDYSDSKLIFGGLTDRKEISSFDVRRTLTLKEIMDQREQRHRIKMELQK